MSEADAQKQAAGEAAAQLVENRMIVGLGTGSTAAWFVKALAARKLDITCVCTSEATAELAASLGMKLAELGDTGEIDLTVDGADEIGPGLSLIKGGGGALLREKLVWEASSRCVAIADAAKVVKTLGAFALPVEVVAFGPDHPGAASVAFYEKLGFEFVEPEEDGPEGGSRDRLRLSLDRELPKWATG